MYLECIKSKYTHTLSNCRLNDTCSPVWPHYLAHMPKLAFGPYLYWILILDYFPIVPLVPMQCLHHVFLLVCSTSQSPCELSKAFKAIEFILEMSFFQLHIVGFIPLFVLLCICSDMMIPICLFSIPLQSVGTFSLLAYHIFFRSCSMDSPILCFNSNSKFFSLALVQHKMY